MKKRILALVLALVLTLSLAPAAMAANSEQQQAADALYTLELFGGTGENKDGTPVFELDRAPTRHEAVTMLVRLLGKETEATSTTWRTPFTDVASWAQSYVGYAYNNGLTAGTGMTTYGGDAPVTAAQYLTFVLRALGYVSGTDFEWNAAWELSDQIGLTDGRYNASTTVFTRGDVALISYRALSTPVKGSNQTLRESIGITEVQGVWSGANDTSSGRFTEIYRFVGSSYTCTAVITTPRGALSLMIYEEGTFTVSGDTLTLTRTRQCVCDMSTGKTSLSVDKESNSYTFRHIDNQLKLNEWVYYNDVKTARSLYNTIRSKLLEQLLLS